MSDYFHESMVAKMIAGTDYQQGYSVGFDSGYKQGREDEQLFVEKRCKELGIDYIQIYTCNGEE